MNADSEYKKKYSLEERKRKAQLVITPNQSHLPIVCEPQKKNDPVFQSFSIPIAYIYLTVDCRYI